MKKYYNTKKEALKAKNNDPRPGKGIYKKRNKYMVCTYTEYLNTY